MNIKPSGLTPLDVQKALSEKNLNQAAIARALNITPGHVSQVIFRKRPSRRVDEAIAEAIGMDIRKIWPDLYLIPGREPKRGRPVRHWNRGAV